MAPLGRIFEVHMVDKGRVCRFDKYHRVGRVDEVHRTGIDHKNHRVGEDGNDDPIDWIDKVEDSLLETSNVVERVLE